MDEIDCRQTAVGDDSLPVRSIFIAGTKNLSRKTKAICWKATIVAPLGKKSTSIRRQCGPALDIYEKYATTAAPVVTGTSWVIQGPLQIGLWHEFLRPNVYRRRMLHKQQGVYRLDSWHVMFAAEHYVTVENTKYHYVRYGKVHRIVVDREG